MIKLVNDSLKIVQAVDLWRAAMLCQGDYGEFGLPINQMGLWGHIHGFTRVFDGGLENFNSSFRLQKADDPCTVQIEIPAHQFNPKSWSAVGEDCNGRLYILRKGRLRETQNRRIKDDYFDQHARWPSVMVKKTDNQGDEKRYYLVACVNDERVQIQNTTFGFVLECQAIRNLFNTDRR